MRTKVRKWGNSLAVRIPRFYAAEAGLSDQTDVEVTLDSGMLCLRPVPAEKVDLEALLAKVTDENIHGEVDWGPAAGKEVW